MKRMIKPLWVALATLSALLSVVSCVKDLAVKEQEVSFDSSLTTEQSQIVKGDSTVTTQLLINEDEADCPRPTKYSVSFTYDEEAGTLFFLGNPIQSGKPISLSSLSDLALTYQAKKLVGNKVDVTVTNDAPKELRKELVWNILAEEVYSVTTEHEGEGKVSVTGADDLDAVKPDTKLAVSAKPADGWELVALTANEEDILEDKSFVVTENTTVRAVFTTEVRATFTKKAPKKTYAVTLTKEGDGEVAISGADNLDAVVTGSKLTVTAEPADGWELASMTANGVDILASKSFEVKSNTTVKVVFKRQPPKTYAVTLLKEGDGTVAITGADNLGAVVTGSKLTVTAEPADGWEVSSITANGKDITADKSFVVTSNTTVKVVFKRQPPKTYAVTLTKEGDGTVAILGADNLGAVVTGSKLTITAEPADGWELASMTANGVDILASKSFVVTENTAVKVVFKVLEVIPADPDDQEYPEFLLAKYLFVDESGNQLSVPFSEYWQYVSVESYSILNRTIDVDKPRSLDIPKDYDKSTSRLGYGDGQYGKNVVVYFVPTRPDRSKPSGPFLRVGLKKPLSDYVLTGITLSEVSYDEVNNRERSRKAIPLTSNSRNDFIANQFPKLADSYDLTGFAYAIAKNDPRKCDSHLEVKYHFKRK